MESINVLFMPMPSRNNNKKPTKSLNYEEKMKNFKRQKFKPFYTFL